MLALFMVLLVPVQVIGGGILLHSAQTVRQNSLEKSERALVAATDRLSSQIDAIYQRAYTWLQNRNSNLRAALQQPGAGKPQPAMDQSARYYERIILVHHQ